MKKYQYQIVRYIHDRLTSEFVNVGIILFEPESKFLDCKFLTKSTRVTHFFENVNGGHLISTLKHFCAEIRRISNMKNDLFFDYKNITQITEDILQKDDSAIECSEIFTGIDIVDPKIILSDLYKRLVGKYIVEQDNDSMDDKKVWQQVYKEYFDRYKVTSKLQSHSFKTSNDKLEFERVWKNGIWHCYQPINFDLKKEDSIKSKIYKWSGILTELEKNKDKIHLHFLALDSSKYIEIKKFIANTLVKRNSQKIEVSMVYEKDAEKFVKNLSLQIQNHG